MLRAHLFGEFTLWVDDRPVPPIQGLRPRSLLAYLLLHPGMHPRTRLAGRFWPEVLETSARASLRSALWAIRTALATAGGEAYLHADRAGVGIRDGLPKYVDVEAFDRLVSIGGVDELEHACGLAAAPLLSDLADEWALDAQDAHRERLVEAMESLAARHERQGDLQEAVRWTRAILAQDRLREAAHRALMRRLDASGERAQALAAYRRARSVLAAELGVPPSPETRALAARLRDDPVVASERSTRRQVTSPGARTSGTPTTPGPPGAGASEGRVVDTGDLPERVIVERLAGLPRDSRTLVDVVVVAGRPVTFSEAAAALDPDADLLAAIDGALETGVVRELEDRRVEIAGGAVARVCADEMSARSRREAHGRLANALLRAADRSTAEIARHFALAGHGAAAQRFFAAAAQEARTVGALDDAQAFLREAIASASVSGSAAGELWLALGDVSAWRGDRPGMDEAFARAVEAFEYAGDPVGRATAQAFRARWLHTTLCFPAEALAAARLALTLIEESGHQIPEAELLALSSAAWAEAVAGDPSVVDGIITRAHATFDGMADRTLEAELEHVRGMALVRGGRFVAGAQTCSRAAELARLAGRPEVAALASLTSACALGCAGDLDGALRVIEQAAGWTSPGHSLSMQLHSARAYTLARLGRREEALSVARGNATAARGFDNPADDALACFDLGVIALECGDHALAVSTLTEALDAPGSAVPRALARLRLAEALVGRGDTDEAERMVGRVPFEPVRAADFPETLVARLSTVQGMIAEARGDVDLARTRYGEAEAVWRRLSGVVSGDAFAAVLVDLGRPPVAGMIEPARELELLAARVSASSKRRASRRST